MNTAIFSNLHQTRPYLWISGLFQNWRECLLGTWHLLRLACKRISGNTVLLAEPNAFHGECLPGFAKYFMDLGCNVIVLMRYNNWKEKPFCRFGKTPELYCLSIWGMRKYLQSAQRRQCRYILLTSAMAYIKEYRYIGYYTDFLNLTLDHSENIGVIEHAFSEDAYEHSANRDGALAKVSSTCFVLTQFDFERYHFQMLNPHYFGKVRLKDKKNSSKIIFVTVGKLEANVRNFDLLLDAIENISEDIPYEVQVIGSGSLSHLSAKCHRHIRLMGRLSFEKMFQCLENADFFLPLLDPSTHANYLRFCTTGSRQLILGFGIIPVIQKDFAEHYGFNTTNAIVYRDSLIDGITEAMLISNEKYTLLQYELIREATRVYDISYANLKRRLIKS